MKEKQDYLDKLPAILRKDLDRNLCTCNEVPGMDIVEAIIDGATSIAEIRKCTYATMGTGCCQQQVERLIECLTTTPTKHRKRRGNRYRNDASRHLPEEKPDKDLQTK